MRVAGLIKYTTIVLFSCLFFQADGQQFLEQVTRNKVKTIKYSLGEEITYMLEGEPGRWYSGEILMINHGEDKILFGGQYVDIQEIIAIRKPNVVMGIVTIFFATSAFSSIIAIIFTPSVPTSEFIHWIWINAGVGVLAYGANRLFRHRKVRIGNRHKLRIIDLDPIGFDNSAMNEGLNNL